MSRGRLGYAWVHTSGFVVWEEATGHTRCLSSNLVAYKIDNVEEGMPALKFTLKSEDPFVVLTVWAVWA